MGLVGVEIVLTSRRLRRSSSDRPGVRRHPLRPGRRDFEKLRLVGEGQDEVDEVPDLGPTARLDHLGIGGVWAGVREVGPDRVGEQGLRRGIPA